MRILLTLWFLSGLWISVSAQYETETTAFPLPRRDSIRDLYIKSFPDQFFIWPVLKQRRLDFELANLEGSKNRLGYKSNKPYSLGVGAYLFELGFELAVAVPLDEQSKVIYGESKTRDIQLNLLGRRWGFETNYQRYKGFYIDDRNRRPPANTPYRQRPDITTRNVGFTTDYTFNNKKFSFRAAYNFAERQLQSAGSLILFGTVNSFRVSADSAMVGPAYNDLYGPLSNIVKVRSTILALAPGYTYSLIYHGFFLNGTLAAGPAHNWMAYGVQDGREVNDIKFSLYLAARLSIGYNGDRYFGGLVFATQGRNAQFENLEMNNSNSSFKLLFGMRFQEKGILKKRVIDIPRYIFN